MKLHFQTGNYTIVTNKAAKGKKGALVAIVEGTASEKVIEVLEKIPEEQREQVKEVTLDLSASMRKIVRRCFPKANRVIDRFHVQALAYDALQEMRIAHRWDAINISTSSITMRKQKRWNKPNLPVKNINPKYSKTEIQKNNSLPEAGIFYSSQQINGRINKN